MRSNKKAGMKNSKKYDNLPVLKLEDVQDTPLMLTLYKALSVKRPAGSREEAMFAAWFATTFGVTLIDEAGNLHFDHRSEGSRTLFTAHSDTVHYKGGQNTIRNDGRYWRACGDVLGADDGAGCALIAHMLTQGVAGYYIIFRGEECGGIGSKWLAENIPELLGEFDRAIAFDRADKYDVVTHQAGTRCCSDEFAAALSDMLSMEESGLLFMPSDGGVYTDTAEFTEIIPECTNISVGYLRQHSNEEEQDISFLQALAENLCLVAWEELPTKRDPAEVDSKWASWGRYGVVQPTLSKRFSKEVEEVDEKLFIGLEEKALLSALTKAMTEDNLIELLVQVRALLGDGDNVYRIQALTDDFLEDCIAALLNGFTAYDVAQDLREMMVNG